MKPELPVLNAKASMVVATPLILVMTFSYVSRAINQPAANVYAVGMAAFGVTAALSGICLTVSESVQGSSTIRYAGEKFLHSSVLVIQRVMLIYLKDSVAGWNWLVGHP